MNVENKLAKPDKTIGQHSNELIEQAKLLYKLGYIKSDDLLADLFVACLKHDNGKANSEFQNRIKKGGKFDNDREVPHSLLSIFYINKEECKDPISVYFAVLFHHYYIESLFKIFTNEDELIKGFLLELGFDNDSYNKMKRNINKVKLLFKSKLYESKKRDAVLLKGLLHKCDYSASAGIDCEKPNDFLLESLDNWKNKFNVNYNDLQKFCIDNSNNNIIVTAPTGMGKTEAGLLWCGDNKCFFVLPLKTAINAMYDRIKNLCGESYKERVALVHSDMKSYYLNNCENIDSAGYDFVYAQYSRQLALPITVCTPDQIFDFALQYPGYEYKLAVSSYSKFIIDEIQMYSPDVLAAIIYAITMIHTLGGKIAVVTATLPPFVREELKDIFGEDVKTADFTYEGKLKHNAKVEEKKLEAEDIIKIFNDTHSEKNKKYLVVCNSIDIANKMYEELKNECLDADINLFHSNFTKNDRRIKEDAILKASEKINDSMDIPEIWISTSVVEASLDIDFDILITELSDLFSLFQRFGRVNRKGKKDYSQYNCYVFTELQGNALRYDFVDKTIHSFSKQAIIDIDGIVSEEMKNSLIEEYLSVENIKNSEYYKKYCRIYNNYKGTVEYLNNKNSDFRHIDRSNAVPITVYNANKKIIDESLYVLNSSDATAEDKLRANETILGFTVSVSKFRIDQNSTIQTINMRYNKIPVIDCIYDSEIGIRYYDKKSESKDTKTDNFL